MQTDPVVVKQKTQMVTSDTQTDPLQTAYSVAQQGGATSSPFGVQPTKIIIKKVRTPKPTPSPTIGVLTKKESNPIDDSISPNDKNSCDGDSIVLTENSNGKTENDTRITEEEEEEEFEEIELKETAVQTDPIILDEKSNALLEKYKQELREKDQAISELQKANTKLTEELERAKKELESIKAHRLATEFEKDVIGKEDLHNFPKDILSRAKRLYISSGLGSEFPEGDFQDIFGDVEGDDDFPFEPSATPMSDVDRPILSRSKTTCISPVSVSFALSEQTDCACPKPVVGPAGSPLECASLSRSVTALPVSGAGQKGSTQCASPDSATTPVTSTSLQDNHPSKIEQYAKELEVPQEDDQQKHHSPAQSDVGTGEATTHASSEQKSATEVDKVVVHNEQEQDSQQTCCADPMRNETVVPVHSQSPSVSKGDVQDSKNPPAEEGKDQVIEISNDSKHDTETGDVLDMNEAEQKVKLERESLDKLGEDGNATPQLHSENDFLKSTSTQFGCLNLSDGAVSSNSDDHLQADVASHDHIPSESNNPLSKSGMIKIVRENCDSGGEYYTDEGDENIDSDESESESSESDEIRTTEGEAPKGQDESIVQHSASPRSEPELFLADQHGSSRIPEGSSGGNESIALGNDQKKISGKNGLKKEPENTQKSSQANTEKAGQKAGTQTARKELKAARSSIATSATLTSRASTAQKKVTAPKKLAQSSEVNVHRRASSHAAASNSTKLHQRNASVTPPPKK